MPVLDNDLTYRLSMQLSQDECLFLGLLDNAISKALDMGTIPQCDAGTIVTLWSRVAQCQDIQNSPAFTILCDAVSHVWLGCTIEPTKQWYVKYRAL